MADYASQLEDNATRDDETICEDCGHPIELHGEDGCTEGDADPCGCMSYEYDEIDEDEDL